MMNSNDSMDQAQVTRLLQTLMEMQNSSTSMSSPSTSDSHQSSSSASASSESSQPQQQVAGQGGSSPSTSPSTSPAATSSSSIPSPPLPPMPTPQAVQESFTTETGTIDFTRLMEALTNNNPAALNVSLSQLLVQQDTPTTSGGPAAVAEPEDPAAGPSTSAADLQVREVKAGEKLYKPRNSRMKVYADGYFMTFDKKSSCATKNFWRCERKNECPARMHTRMDSFLIVKRIHPHNHHPPSSAELSFYDLDLRNVVPDHVIPVNSVSRSIHKCRRISRVLEAAGHALPSVMPGDVPELNIQTTAPEVVAHEVVNNFDPMYFGANGEEPTTSNASNLVQPIPNMDPATLLNQFQIQNSPRMNPETVRSDLQRMIDAQGFMNQLQRNVKRELPCHESGTSSSSSQDDGPPSAKRQRTDNGPSSEEFAEMFQMVKQLHDHFFGDNTAASSTSAAPAPVAVLSFTIYVSMLKEGEEEDAEQDYHLLKVSNRNLTSLRIALQLFAGKKCTQNILVSISPRINFVVSDVMIADWADGRIFKLDTRKSTKGWKLIPVDK